MLLPAASRGSDRSLPMHFDLRHEGSACGAKCRLFVAASGAITADTPRDFLSFAKEHELAGATVVLDSDGGSVHGAIALGREIRRLELDTTVGHLVDLDGAGAPRAKLSPQGSCESMCAFVLIAGVHRFVPSEARVMVHQIWLGDRREDPTAATYSAEDLVLVQRDIGRLVRYTADMGGSMEMVDLALRIPPWEPMHTMTSAEIRAAGLEMAAPDAGAATVASLSRPLPAAQQPELPHVTDGARPAAISEQHWAMVDHAGGVVLARRQPLTFGGESIGSFDLMVACAAGDSYEVNYLEHRRSGSHTPVPEKLGHVAMSSAEGVATFKLVSSQHSDDELVTYAAATVPAKLIGAFAAAGDHSMMITTESAAGETAIRIGNTGAEQSLPLLATACQKLGQQRASLEEHRAGGLASAK